MILCTIDKYVNKKKKDLLEYAETLESFITVQRNRLWKNKKEFKNYSSSIIANYCDNYYFEKNTNISNPIAYSNDNINFVLRSIIDYFNKDNKTSVIHDCKNEVFLLSIIISTACYVDFASNTIEGNILDTKNKFKYFLDYLKKTNVINISSNKSFINTLFDKVKKNIKNDSKVFELAENDKFYNKYTLYNKKPVMYKFNYEYKLDNLDEIDSMMAKELEKKYRTKFLEMSYNLLIINMLKEKIINSDQSIYLLSAQDELLKKISLVRIFNNKYLKDKVMFIVEYAEKEKYENVIKEFNKIDVKVLLNYDVEDFINPSLLERDNTYLVSRKFIKNNKDNMDIWKNNNISFMELEMGD